MKKGKKVRVIDPARREYLLEGPVVERCRACKVQGYEGWFVQVGGTLNHFLREQLKEIR